MRNGRSPAQAICGSVAEHGGEDQGSCCSSGRRRRTACLLRCAGLEGAHVPLQRSLQLGRDDAGKLLG
jgi:hypothetical protein